VRAATAVTRFKQHRKCAPAATAKGDAPVAIQRNNLVDLLHDRRRTSVAGCGERTSGQKTKGETEVRHSHA
jgi:hypothetical protein